MAGKQLTPKKRALLQRRARTLTSGLRLESWESWIIPNAGDTYRCQATDRYGRPVPVEAVDIAKRFVRDWDMKIMVRCRTDDGQVYIESREITARGAKLQELTDFFKTQRADALASVNHHHIVDVGWIARALRDNERKVE